MYHERKKKMKKTKGDGEWGVALKDRQGRTIVISMKCPRNKQTNKKQEGEINELCLASHAEEGKGISLSVDLDEALLEVSALYQEIIATNVCDGA